MPKKKQNNARTPLQKKYDKLVKMGLPESRPQKVEIVFRQAQEKPLETRVSYGAADYLTV